MLTYVFEPNACKFEHQKQKILYEIKLQTMEAMDVYCPDSLIGTVTIKDVFNNFNLDGENFDNIPPDDRADIYSNITMYVGVIISLTIKGSNKQDFLT